MKENRKCAQDTNITFITHNKKTEKLNVNCNSQKYIFLVVSTVDGLANEQSLVQNKLEHLSKMTLGEAYTTIVEPVAQDNPDADVWRPLWFGARLNGVSIIPAIVVKFIMAVGENFNNFSTSFVP